MQEKIKIRISSFVLLIIENDCQIYNFINADDTPNKNKFLNKLIPNLLTIRKDKREKIEKVLKNDFNRVNAGEIYELIGMLIDKVYFSDEELNILDAEIWIRPHKSCEAVFDEIRDNETKITALDLSSYIRGLLNEYSRFPQYKRGSILFYEELRLIKIAMKTARIINFTYKGERFRLYAYQWMYGVVFDQTNYLIGFDIIRNQIRSFDIASIDNIYMIKQKFKASDKLENALQNFLNDYVYSDEAYVEYKEE